jgi:hypothetical protein
MPTDINSDDLRERLHSLPQELYDKITALVLQSSEVPCSPITFPAHFHINRKSRAHYLKLLANCSDEDYLPHLKNFLGSGSWNLCNSDIGDVAGDRVSRFWNEG